MVEKIRLSLLQQKLQQGTLTEEEMEAYFLRTDGDAPFQPGLAINWDNVERDIEDDSRSALLLNGLNAAATFDRQMRFHQAINGGYRGPTLAAEGDSWFQYPLRLRDVIDCLGPLTSYPIYCTSAAGDLLSDMAAQREYVTGLTKAGARILLLSGGGNDLCAGGALARHLERFDPGLKPHEYIRRSYVALLDDAFSYYERIFRDVLGAVPGATVVCHGYDYAIPRADGRWLGKPMLQQGIADPALQRAITAVMVDMFNKGLKRVAAMFEHVRHVDCRGAVPPDEWYDELHPTNTGFLAASRRIAAVVEDIVHGRPEAAPPPQPVPAGARTRGPGEVEEEERPVRDPIGVSLHVGLNGLNPDDYAGWDGRLAACENDATAMELLARREGYRTQRLVTAQATRAAVVGAIEAAADELWAGDTFLMTISAHGSQVRDYNGDEASADPSDTQDETYCLYDGQVIDDEMFSLYRRFRRDVRVVIVADCCHSGGALRRMQIDAAARAAGAGGSLADRLAADAARDAPRVRLMPDSVRTRIALEQEDRLRDYARQFRHINESIVTSPLTSDIEASVLQLSACTESQLASDGDEYGAFTAALLATWRDGRFTGDYQAFHRAILDAMRGQAQTPVLKTFPIQSDRMLKLRALSLWGPGQPSRPVRAGPLRSAAEGGEGNEHDVPEPRLRGRSRSPASTVPEETVAAFTRFLEEGAVDLGPNFRAAEFLTLGGSHSTPGARAFNLNSPPPETLWKNIVPTMKLLVALRARLGEPIRITNAYRNSAYNRAVGGEPHSFHMTFQACDIQSSVVSPAKIHATLEAMAAEGAFTGGLGRYDSFIHVDTRGTRARWDNRTRSAPAPETSHRRTVEA